MTQDTSFLTVSQATERLNSAGLSVSRDTVQRWCRMRWLPAAKIGKEYRIRRDDLDRWYQSRLKEGRLAPEEELEQGA